MHNKKIFHHTSYYFIELAVLLLGFTSLIVFGFSLTLQLIILVGLLVAYIIMGVLHHKIHHDLHIKIVLEYMLISLLILVAFVFLNIEKL